MITLHTAFGIAALLIGPLIFLRRKGDGPHRLLGRGFFCAMLGVNGTAFGIYEMTGGPSIFHALAILSLLTVWRGYAAIRRGEVARHLSYMIFAYAGLIAALGSRLPALLPSWPYGLALALGIGLPFVMAELLVRQLVRRMPASAGKGDQASAA